MGARLDRRTRLAARGALEDGLANDTDPGDEQLPGERLGAG